MDNLYCSNAAKTTASGFDAEIEGRWVTGLTTAVGYTYVRATDGDSGEPLSNSPRHLTNLSVSAPLRRWSSRVALDVRGVAERRDLDGRPIPGFVLGNVTMARSIGKKLDLEFDIYNVLNRHYADPGAEEHLQRAIEQDGRTFRVRLIARF